MMDDSCPQHVLPLAALIDASGHLAPVQSTPVRSAPPKHVVRRSVEDRLAPARLAFFSHAPRRSIPLRFAPARLAPLASMFRPTMLFAMHARLAGSVRGQWMSPTARTPSNPSQTA